MRYINPLGQEEPNAQYNTNRVGVKIAVGIGNAGAVGLRLRAAQGSGAEDVEIIFEGGNQPNAGLAGIVGGCGSGGAHHSVKVQGGRYGLDLRMSQPASTTRVLASASDLWGVTPGACKRASRKG